MTMYKITIQRFGGLSDLGVELHLPPLIGYRHSADNSILIGVKAGSINIPATGDLCPVNDLPHFLRAVKIAQDIARGDLIVEGMELFEEPDIPDPTDRLGG